MKQKNVILMVVAAVCGLAAAVLTTQMSGKPAAPDQVEILAAAKELPVGMKLDKQKLGELIKKKKVGKSEVPQEGVFFKEEELADKYIQRPRGVDDVIMVSDVGPKPPGLSPPEGKHLLTIKLPYEHVGPFVVPGSRVDIECAVQTQVMRRLRQFTLLTDVQVLAVDTVFANGGSQKGDQGNPQINTVTLALAPHEVKWFQIATRLGSDLRLIIRGEKSQAIKQLTEDELNRMFFEQDAPGGNGSPEGKPKGTVVKLWVPRSFLSAGTAITEETIRDKFREKDFEENEAPKDGVTDLTDYLGKYLVRDAERGEPLGKDAFGEKPLEKEPVKPAPPANDPPKGPKTETAPYPRKIERKPIKIWEPEITSPKGTEKHRYEMFDEKEGWIYRGVIGKDGKVVPGPAPDKVPEAPPADDKGGKIS